MSRRSSWLTRGATLTGLLVLGACSSGGYRAENEAIVAELPVPDVVGSFEVEHYDFCSRTSCLSGPDRSGVLLTYELDGAGSIDSIESQRALVDEYVTALEGWDASIDEGCANADTQSFCDEIVFATFTRGAALVSLTLDNWPTGFEAGVDARGVENP